MAERLLAGLLVVPFLLGAAAAPVDTSQVAFSFEDSDIIESSGLAVADGLVVTTNDSGDTGRVFTVDPATGRTVGVTDWADDPQDVEALAPLDDDEVWVGDIGDNGESRDTIQVAQVPVGPGDDGVDGPVYDLAYPDGPHDAETLMTDPSTGRLYVATKGVLGGTLYAAPAHLSPDRVNRLEPLGDVLPVATDGAFLADGRHFVVRNYAVAAVYAFPSLEKVDQLRLPDQPQGEGLAVEPDGSLLLSSEGLHSKVLRVTLPTGSASPSPSAPISHPEPTPDPNPPSRTTPSRTRTPSCPRPPRPSDRRGRGSSAGWSGSAAWWCWPGR